MTTKNTTKNTTKPSTEHNVGPAVSEEAAVNSGRRSLEAEAASTPIKAKPPKDDEDRAVWEQGRTARLNGIGKDDAPHGSDTDTYKTWLKGWESLGD